MGSKHNTMAAPLLAALFITATLAAGCSTVKDTYRTLDGFAQGGTYHLVYELPAGETEYNLPDSLAKYFLSIDNSLSGYDSTSLVSLINRGENPPLDHLFIECFNLSKEVYEATGGAFDISAAPLFDIWGFGFREKEKITQAKVDSIRKFVGMDKLSIVYDTVAGAHFLRKADPRMKVNFNAIAQGFTCDYICSRLEKMGINNYLLEVGGEIMCKGVNAKGNEWNIAIDKPLDGNFVPGEEVQAIIELSGRGLVTSGNYRKFYVEEGEKFSHTIDPATGRPVKHNLLSATVIAPTAAMADAYATFFMVIGLEKAKEFLEGKEDMDALLVYGEQEHMKVFSTAGIKQKELQ
ncbi:MAG: FAD:protein FMN transferase [Bacteroidales bacterium]|nr:FAD:protein FMN transferase [Bacteroidales bacterium]